MRGPAFTPTVSARLERIPPGARRDAFLPLFRAADDSDAQVQSYYQRGDLFVFRGSNGEALGITLVVGGGDTATRELKAVAVVPDRQGAGIGSRMVRLTLDQLRHDGARRVTVATGNCAIGPIAFYQTLGFRFWRIERDFFTAARGYPPGLEEDGIPLRDLVWMDLDF